MCAGLLVAPGCGGTENDTKLGPSQANPLDDEESSLVQRVNDHRAASGIGPVTQCAILNVSASKHADDMRDKDYLSDKGNDGSTPRSRGCAEGYPPACGENTPMAELVASGIDDSSATLGQWTKAASTNDILLNPGLIVVGVGRATGMSVPFWAVDLGGTANATCEATPSK
jgi:uncharacterized protein YkwD